MKTYLDAGVLLSAWRGNSPRSATTKTVLEDESREFFTSEAVKLELLPKATLEKRQTEVDFYNSYFHDIPSERCSAELGNDAMALAKKFGLAALDALHLASAIRQGADEFITSELPGKPMFRVPGITVVSLYKL